MTLNGSNSISQETIILGDLNTDMQKHNTLIFKHFVKSYALKQLTVDPTRITLKTQTIIDIILVSDHSKICRSGVLEAGISDHCIVYLIRKLRRKLLYYYHNTAKIQKYRNTNSDSRNTVQKFLKKNLVRLTGLR